MADTTVTRTLIIRGSAPGVDEAAGSLRELAKAQENVAVVSETTSRRTLSMADVFNQLERSYVAGARQAQEFEKVVRQVNAAVSQNPALQERANAVLQQAAERLGQVGSALNRAREAQEQYNRSISNTAQNVNQRIGVKDDFGTQARGEDIAAYGAAMDALRAKYDPLFAAGQRYKTALDGINQAERAGAITAQIATDARLKETSSFNDQIQKLERLGAAKKAAAQTMVNQQTIVPDRGADIAAYGKQLDDLRAKYNPLFAAGQQYKASLTEINAAARVGAISEKERADAVMNTKVAFTQQVNTLRGVHEATKLAAESTDAHTNSSKLARHELINLSRQGQDVFVSLQAGQSLATVALQQGSQIFDVFASSQASAGSAIKGIATTVLGAITPLRTFAAAGLAMGAAAVVSAFNWRDSQREISTALVGIGRESGATLGGINKVTVDAAANTKLYSGEARELAIALIQTGKIGAEQIRGITDLSYGAARILGVDLPEANKFLAESFADPARGIEAMAAKFGGATAAMKQQVIDLVEQGKTGEAQSLMVRMFAGTAKAAEQVGTLETAWRGAVGGVKSFWDQFNLGLDRITGLNALEDKLVMLDRKLRSLNQQQQVESGQRVPGASIREGETGAEAKLRGATEERAGLNVQKQLAESGLGKEIGNILTGLGEINTQGVLSFTNISNRLADMGKKLAPEIDQLRQMKAVLEDLNNIDRPQVRAGMAPEQVKAVEQARDAYKATVGFIEQARSSYKGVTDQAAVQLTLMNDQVKVANALGTSTRLRAQEEALVNQGLAQRMPLIDAQRAAAAQIGVIKAQEVAQTREALAAARDQVTVAQAVTGAEQIRAATLAEIAQAQRTLGGDAEALANATAAAYARQEAAFAQINAAAEMQLRTMKDQEAVAGAVNEVERMQAQEIATVNDLLAKGVELHKAQAIAAQGTTNAQAAITAGAQRTIAAKESELRIVRAGGGEDGMRQQRQEQYNKAIKDGVSERDAADARHLQWKIDEEKISAQILAGLIAANAVYEQKIQLLSKETRSIEAIRSGTQDMVRGANAYEEAMSKGTSSVVALEYAITKSRNAMANLALEAERAQAAMERMESFSGWGGFFGSSTGSGQLTVGSVGSGPAGAVYSRVRGRGNRRPDWAGGGVASTLDTMFGPGGTEGGSGLGGGGSPNQQGLNYMVDTLLKQGQSLQDAINEVNRTTGEAKFSVLQDLYRRLSDEGNVVGAIAGMQQQIALLQSQPRTLERDDLIKSLNDSIKGLQQSTENLNSTMGSILSELYTTDPRISKMGFRPESGPLNYDPFKQPIIVPSPSIVPSPPAPVSGPNFGPNPGWGWPLQERPGTWTPVERPGPTTGTVVPPYTSTSIVVTEEMRRQQRERGIYGLAEGGIMTDHGPMRLNKYAGGGIVDSPQMFMAGEGYRPEAIVPLPDGRSIPIKQVGDKKDKPSTVININAPLVHFAAEPTRDEVKETAFQAGARMRSMMAG